MERRAGWLAPLAGVLAAAVTAVLWPAPAGGAERTAALRAQAATLVRAEQAAVLELYAAESALDDARATLAGLEARSAALAARTDRLARHATLARRSLAVSQARTAEILRLLYVEGDEADPLALVLGAESLDAVLEGLDGLERAGAQNRRLARETAGRAAALTRRLARLRAARAELDRARQDAGRAAGSLEAAVAAKARVLAGVRSRQGVTRDRLAVLEAEARAAVARSAAVERAGPQQAASAPAAETAPEPSPETAAAPAARPGSAGTSLVVDAVAYHLPGRTASGLPVGVGVIAVDPNVIPLGTRVFVPGYGPAVAADVGTAIKGNIIDLWMPSTAQARAWGRRTVTITVYR